MPRAWNISAVVKPPIPPPAMMALIVGLRSPRAAPAPRSGPSRRSARVASRRHRRPNASATQGSGLARWSWAGRIPPMRDPDRRDASLDLTGEDFRALLAGVTALVEQEVAAAQSGPVFERPPSGVEIDRMVGADRALPADGESVDELLAACAAVLAAGRRTTPTFFGYVQSPPAPVGVAADLLASAADQNLTSWRSGPAAAAVEHQTLRWLGEFVGFDAAATGILVSGGSAANLTALLVALRAVTGPDDDRRAMRVYASAETHFSVAKAATALGVGLEPVAVDGERRLDAGALRMAIASDRAA